MSLTTGKVGQLNTGKVIGIPKFQFNAQKYGVAQNFNTGEYNLSHPRVKYDGEIAGPNANFLDYRC